MRTTKNCTISPSACLRRTSKLLQWYWQGGGLKRSDAGQRGQLPQLTAHACARALQVIRFDEGAFTRYGTGKKRPYTLYFFLTAKQVMDNPHLALEPLRAEFGLAAQAVARGPEPDSAFFADVVFEDAQKIFHALGVNQVRRHTRLCTRCLASSRTLHEYRHTLAHVHT